jgi:hypothetical protein
MSLCRVLLLRGTGAALLRVARVLPSTLICPDDFDTAYTYMSL